MPATATIRDRIKTLLTRRGTDLPETLTAMLEPKRRGGLVQTILGHPTNAPTMRELDYYEPSTDTATVESHLEALIDASAVMKLPCTAEPNDTQTGEKVPDAFYALTPRAFDLLEEYDVFVDELDEIQEDYSRVEKTEEIVSLEQIPRPETRCHVYPRGDSPTR